MTEKVIYHKERCNTIDETTDAHREMTTVYEINIRNTKSDNIKEVEK